jgi:hypothetical protein
MEKYLVEFTLIHNNPHIYLNHSITDRELKWTRSETWTASNLTALEDKEVALAVFPQEEKAQSSWQRRRPAEAAGIGGHPGEAEEGLERRPASRLHSNTATRHGATETGACSAQAQGYGSLEAVAQRRQGPARGTRHCHLRADLTRGGHRQIWLLRRIGSCPGKTKI